MNLLPTIKIDNFINDSTLSEIENMISKFGNQLETITESPNESNDVLGHLQHWEYYSDQTSSIRNVLDPLLQDSLKIKLNVQSSHILDSRKPYKIHSDFHHAGEEGIPAYTIIIPLDDYNSYTIVFNESIENSNSLEDFKKDHLPHPKLTIDPKFCSERLNHCHPMDLKYLTLADAFKWKKGSMFAMDRRFFHCSDNYRKHEHSSKRGIIIWTNYA